jgi:hypothetical protein
MTGQVLVIYGGAGVAGSPFDAAGEAAANEPGGARQSAGARDH